ncbi:MAG: hypothetical protein HFI37_00025 [Lachnospiraceae bacterium]|nr:hypothetical protein [Lachnospiraceae bacterium]
MDMKNIVKVDKRFQKAVNLTLDFGDMDRVNHYIPTKSSVSILKQYLENIEKDQAEHATILIGPYGKGKSHLLLVLLALLCSKDKKKTKEVREKIISVKKSTEKLFEKISESKPFLPVIISSFQGDLNETFIFSLQEALKREGITDLTPESEYTESIQAINVWKKDYPATYEKFLELLGEKGYDKKNFCEGIKKQEKEKLFYFKEIYPLLTSGSNFMPMIQKDALQVYKEVNRALCSQYSYAGIYIIFDEFSKYIEGHERVGFSKDMKIIQDMCELADNSGELQMYITFVAHKSIHEYVKSIDSEMIQAFRGVEGRLKEIQFVVSSQNNFELIESAIQKETEFFTKEIRKKTEKSYDLTCFSNLFEREDFIKIVAKGCYPLTPLCAYTLLQISEKIGQNERTVFTFIAGDEPGSLPRVIEKRHSEELVGVDCVYDYFKNLFRETLDQPQIHKEWLKADYALTKAETEEEKRFIKAMAVIRMVRRPEELSVSKPDMTCALDISEEVYDRAIESLMDREIIFFRASLGTLAFKNNIGIDIEKEIEKEMRRLRDKMDVCAMLNEISELTYALPKQYNQNRAMTRYFRYEFVPIEKYMAVNRAEYFFENRF